MLNSSLRKSTVHRLHGADAWQDFWCLVYASTIVAAYVAAIHFFM